MNFLIKSATCFAATVSLVVAIAPSVSGNHSSAGPKVSPTVVSSPNHATEEMVGSTGSGTPSPKLTKPSPGAPVPSMTEFDNSTKTSDVHNSETSRDKLSESSGDENFGLSSVKLEREWNSQEAADFYTDEKIIEAFAQAGRRENPRSEELQPEHGSAQSIDEDFPVGIPSVGVVIYTEVSGFVSFCTASTVNSAKGLLVASASHCFARPSESAPIAYVPMVSKKSNKEIVRPFGTFSVAARSDGVLKLWKYPHGNAAPNTWQDDAAFMRLQPNERNQTIDSVVPGHAISFSAPLDDPNVVLAGYNGADPPLRMCGGKTSSAMYLEKGKDWGPFRKMDWGGFTAGSSGSPFLSGFNSTTNVGTLVGVIGGPYGGGLLPVTSWSSDFRNDRIRKLYLAAMNDEQALEAPSEALGDSDHWTNQKFMTSGYFHGAGSGTKLSDLVSVDKSGQVVLYLTDGDGGFVRRINLNKPDTFFANNVRSISSGDFSGSDVSDLIVLWTDGEITIYEDVNENNRLTHEKQMQPQNEQWNMARQIAAGNFGNNQHADDLVVAWLDGEVSLYSDNGIHPPHNETTLIAKDSIWSEKFLRSLTSADAAGNDHSDLVALWVDGELSLHQDIDPAGMHKETTLHRKNGLWGDNARFVSAGSFDGNGWPDDVLVTWKDGELTEYINTGEGGLGLERILVAPGMRDGNEFQNLPINRRLKDTPYPKEKTPRK